MILGLGSDLVDIGRIERVIARFGERFLERVFTMEERAKSDSRANPAASYARRYAAKEACAKALGTGFRAGIRWRDLGVTDQGLGRPGMILTGMAHQRLLAMAPAGMTARIDLSLADEPPLAQAVVIISAVPARREAGSQP